MPEPVSGIASGGPENDRRFTTTSLHSLHSLLILDEPTSRMDPRGAHGIFERIKAISGDRITIVVTHRPENTGITDHIIVMEKGRITEHGTFADLLRLSQDR